MSRQLVFYKEHFIDFYRGLEPNVREKIQYVFELIKQVERVPVKFLAPMTGYESLYEIRIEYQSNIYSLFCCFDKGKLIVIFNGFHKKTQTTPKNEIEKAMRLKQEYFNLKNNNDGQI